MLWGKKTQSSWLPLHPPPPSSPRSSPGHPTALSTFRSRNSAQKSNRLCFGEHRALIKRPSRSHNCFPLLFSNWKWSFYLIPLQIMMWSSQVASSLIGLFLIFQMERFEQFNNVAKWIFSVFVTVNLFRLREAHDIKKKTLPLGIYQMSGNHELTISEKLGPHLKENCCWQIPRKIIFWESKIISY